MVKRRTYSAEFKCKALALAEAPYQTIRQVTADLGIHETLIQSWLRQLRSERLEEFHVPGQYAR